MGLRGCSPGAPISFGPPGNYFFPLMSLKHEKGAPLLFNMREEIKRAVEGRGDVGVEGRADVGGKERDKT